jgi:diguanylate cyclase (GGDEF)-like protein
MTDCSRARFVWLILLAALFCVSTSPAFAAPPLVISGAKDSYPLLPSCDAAAGDLAFDRIVAGARFVPVDRLKPQTFPAVIWLRCELRNADARDHRLWLITMGNDISRAEIYQPTPQGYRVAITGMQVPFNERSDRYYYPAFAIDDNAFAGRPIYMHLVYYQYFPLNISVRTEHRSFGRIEPYRIIEGIFFGVLLAVAFFNLFVFVTMRDPSTLLYVAYIAALIANELASTGIGAQYVWPNFAPDERWIEWITTTASFGTALLFVRSFLQTRKTVPVWDIALIACFFVEAITHLTVVAILVPVSAIVILLFIQLLAMAITGATGVVRWRQGFAAARFFVIGFLPATVGYFANLAYDVFTPPGNWFWATNGVELGAMFQSVLISFSLLDRLRILDRQREEARAELTIVSQEALRLHDLALHDPLTGLANRMLFTEELGRALLRANRKGTRVAVLFADLDGFKPINDVYGHRVGDLVLKAVAQRLKDTLRRVDLTSRLGGDEFAIIVEDLTSEEQAAQICDTVGKLLEAPLLIDNTAMPIGISVGCSLFPQDGASVDQLLHAADLRMYATKEAHKRGEDPLAMKAPSSP